MPGFTKSLLALFTATCLFPFLLSCSSSSSQRAIDFVSPSWLPKDGSPSTVAIMPFDNLTPHEEMGTLVRKSFYNHFSSKNYRDIELSTVDRGLESIHRTQSGAWRDVPPETLGKYLHADFVIYGKVKDYQKLFFGVYSQIALTVELEMVDCRNGKGVWWKTETKRSHDGGIPVELLSLMSATARSAMHMQLERTLDLVEKINRDLVNRIPEPAVSPAGPLSVNIQIASFLEKSRATSTVEECKRIGFEPRVETVQITDRTWYRVVLGPYKEIPAAERDKKLIVEKTTFHPVFVHHPPGDQEASSR